MSKFPYPLKLSPDGTTLATSEFEYKIETIIHRVNIRNTTDGSIKKSLDILPSENIENYTIGLTYSNDGLVLETNSVDGSLTLWNTEDYSEISTASLGIEGLPSPIFSPDKRFLTFQKDNTVILWNISKNEFIFTLDPEAYYSSDLYIAFSPDSSLIAIGDSDGKISIWNIADGSKLTILRGHTDNISSIIFSPDGTQIISGSRDGTIRIWGIP